MSAAHAPRFRVCVLAGDGIGPEVMAEAVKVLKAATQAPGVEHAELEFVEAPVGGAAYEACGEHLPASTLHACALSDAVLFGSVGGPPDEAHLPKWKNAERNAILGIRKHFELAINLRPSRVVKSLAAISPLKDTVIGEGVDILIVRELVGGAYFGAHETAPDGRSARDDLTYTWEQVENALRFAFIAASGRRRKLTVVDKANVLETSRLWRAVTAAVKGDYPDVSVEFMYVDNAAMQLVTHPTSFDVIVTENLFGDILSDEASVLPGSLGLMPSASLSTAAASTSATGHVRSLHLFEPIGGTAPDIAGKGVANPIAQILSAAMLARHSLHLPRVARAIEEAVDQVLAAGLRTRDLLPRGATLDSSMRIVGTVEMGDAVAAATAKLLTTA